MRTRQGETICLGEWIRPASADFPPAGGVWGGMRAGFGLGVFGNFAIGFRANKIGAPPMFLFYQYFLSIAKLTSFQILLC